MMRENEVDLLEACGLLDVPEEVLGQLLAQGKLKSRIEDGDMYFVREDIDALVERQIAEVFADAEEGADGPSSPNAEPVPGKSRKGIFERFRH
jgi:hypothetical protein